MRFDRDTALLFPKIINVTVLGGACPCACVHCPVGQVPFERRGERFGGLSTMDMALFEKIVDETAEAGTDSAVRLHSVGEPLLWDGLPEALAYCGRRGVRSWLFTSAVTRDKRLLEAICGYGDIIEISVNASDRRDYAAVKGLDAFGLVAENIGYMDSYIQKHSLDTRLLLSRVQSDDIDTDGKFLAYWRGKGYKSVRKPESVFIRSYHDYNGAIEVHDKAVKKPCLVHWARFSINTDGAVSVCMNEFFKEGFGEHSGAYLGNVREQSVKSIWNGAKLSQIRELDLAGRLGELPYELCCKTCTSCQPLDTERTTSETQLGRPSLSLR